MRRADRVDLTSCAELDDGDLEEQIAGQVGPLQLVVELREAVECPRQLPRTEGLPRLPGQRPQAPATHRSPAQACRTTVAARPQDQQLSQSVGQRAEQHDRGVAGVQRPARRRQGRVGVVGDDRVGDREARLATMALQDAVDVLLAERGCARRRRRADGGDLYGDGPRFEPGVAADRGDRGGIGMSTVGPELVADQPLPLLVGPVRRPRHVDVGVAVDQVGEVAQGLGEVARAVLHGHHDGNVAGRLGQRRDLVQHTAAGHP